MILANSAISIFYRKRENKRKEKKGLHGLDLAHNEVGPTARIQPRSRTKAHSDLDILH
jgi:hypothetical protein